MNSHLGGIWAGDQVRSAHQIEKVLARHPSALTEKPPSFRISAKTLPVPPQQNARGCKIKLIDKSGLLG
jgi:hypothetical protein